MELDVLTQAIDGLVGAGPEMFGDGESIKVLQRQLNRLESFATECVGAFDAGGEWALSGAKTAGAWIATNTHAPRKEVRRNVALSKKLRSLPDVAEAFRDGDIGPAAARAICALHDGRTEEALERDEAQLVRHAKRLGFEDFYRALNYWQQLADPDGADADEMEKRASRHAYLEQSVGGMWFGQMTLDPISGAIVSNELERLEKIFFAEDWAEATERLGRTPKGDELLRTAGQRRADAFIEMATRSRVAPADGIRPAPLFSVFVGYETLNGRISELENGCVIAPGALVPYLKDAYFERALFTLGTRVDVSVRARLFTGGTRRAIELRDRMCQHENCWEPAVNCEVDHVVEWSQGGETTQENGRLLCGFHNRTRNQDLGRKQEQIAATNSAGRAPPGA
jgi:Domain of unknown function (DUF222)/HNH endonuclease